MDMGAVLVALDAQVGAGEAFRPGLLRADAQELVEMLPVDHADEAVLDRDVDAPPGGGDHARGGDLGDELIFGDVEIADQARRDRAAAGLDPARAVDQRHLVPRPGEVFGSGCTGGATPTTTTS
jgi:hypothetical protein